MPKLCCLSSHRVLCSHAGGQLPWSVHHACHAPHRNIKSYRRCQRLAIDWRRWKVTVDVRSLWTIRIAATVAEYVLMLQRCWIELTSAARVAFQGERPNIDDCSRIHWFVGTQSRGRDWNKLPSVVKPSSDRYFDAVFIVVSMLIRRSSSDSVLNKSSDYKNERSRHLMKF